MMYTLIFIEKKNCLKTSKQPKNVDLKRTHFTYAENLNIY